MVPDNMTISEQIHELQIRIIDSAPLDKRQAYLDVVDQFVDCAADYVIQTTAMETGIELLRFRLEGLKFRKACEKMDTSKRQAHDCFIAKLQAINRISIELTGQPFYSGETDRWSIGNYAFSITSDLKCAS